MKKLTKGQLEDKAKHSSAIFDAHAELESAIDPHAVPEEVS
jgi:hypothetical protein